MKKKKLETAVSPQVAYARKLAAFNAMEKSLKEKWDAMHRATQELFGLWDD